MCLIFPCARKSSEHRFDLPLAPWDRFDAFAGGYQVFCSLQDILGSAEGFGVDDPAVRAIS
jgi:hypothetical protein